MRRQRFILTAVLLMAILSPTVAHSLIYLNLDIRLYKDGSAKVTEKRTCMIDDEGTEGYITMLNMGDIGIYNLSVKDERGVEFLCEQGNWDTKRSRREKTYRCGIHQINGGVELCWGIGKAGMRTYEISYTLTNLVKAYTDYDGFNHSFYEVDNTPAQAASLTITLDGDSLHRPTSRVWAFGFPGRVMLDNGQMSIAASEPLKEGGSMIVMCQFDKGIFTPGAKGEGAFAEVRHKAFEGSDYQEELYRERDEDSIPLSGIPTSLMGGYGFTGENKAPLSENASDTLSDLMGNSWIFVLIIIGVFILYRMISGWGGGSSSGGRGYSSYSGGGSSSSSRRSESDRSSGWGGSSSSRGGGGHSGGGGSGFR